MNNRPVQIMAVLCGLAGLSLFFYKAFVLGFPLTADAERTAWTIEASLRFNARPGPIKAELKVPALTSGFATLSENSVSGRYGFNLEYADGGRLARWSRRSASGEQRLYYRVVVAADPSVEEADTTPPFPEIPVLTEPSNTAAMVLMGEVREQSADTDTLVAELLQRVNDPSPEPNVELLFDGLNGSLRRAERLVELLAYARVPARPVRGLLLADEQRNVPVRTYLEVHNGVRWSAYNLRTGQQGLAKNFYPWWRGFDVLSDVQGGSDIDLNFAVRRSQLDSLDVVEQRSASTGSMALDFSLFSLPIQTQAVYSVLLMVPIGALVMVILRNFVGLQTFGTFMPVLIAIAFRETDLLAGVILFSLLTSLGLAIRFGLERLRLLLVPRLTAVLIIVVILMLVISILAHRIGLETGLSVALFPMVIIAMTIERMSVIWEERGAADAVKAGVGSLLVAAFAYLVMGIDALEHLIFTFPELLLAVLALVLLSGRYTGYRLLELPRFRALEKTD
ncbi:MAG: inactive transglutaminase family protein [Pseudomonadota bacterium]